jgi:hypothetical protein
MAVSSPADMIDMIQTMGSAVDVNEFFNRASDCLRYRRMVLYQVGG